MPDTLSARIARLRIDPRILSLSESALKQSVVLPILRDLGWRTDELDEVIPEFSVENRRVDFALRLKQTSEVFIEVKTTLQALQRHEEQILEYAFRQGVDVAVLTSGLTWWLYLPKEKGPWTGRKFITIDFGERSPEEAASDLQRFLSRDQIGSGRAVELATELHRSQKSRRAAAAALPRAWERLVRDQDDLLIELLAETTEKISGYRPDIDQVSEFLQRQRLDATEPRNVSLPVRAGASSRPRPSSGQFVTPPPPDKRLSQHDLVPEILRVLSERGGRARKREVEAAIAARFSPLFDGPWYQEPVSHGVPRWKHNIAWAKEIAKQQGLIKPPADSGHGVWELTSAGRAAARR